MRYLGGECVMAAEINEECKKHIDLITIPRRKNYVAM